MTILDINSSISKIVDSRIDDVFSSLLSKAFEAHVKASPHVRCDCNYCLALRRYSEEKIKMHHLNKLNRSSFRIASKAIIKSHDACELLKMEKDREKAR